MMRRETAYRLAGRHHQHEDVLDGALRRQEIRFSGLEPEQCLAAVEILRQMPGLGVVAGPSACSLMVHYDLAHYCLRGLEDSLVALGFRLDDSLFFRLKRSWAYFCEETLSRNAKAPHRLIKQSSQVYVKAYEYHPHGDHDDTPPELREDK